jgi:predicted RNA binding protein YcfA (HicA-like mRNA interferase family)
MPKSSRYIIKKLEQNGWYKDRVKGSHYHFKHPEKKGLVTVVHPEKDIKLKTLKRIEEQSGLSFR